MSILTNIDQAAERKASLTLEGGQLAMLKLESPQIGQCVKVCAEICIESITAYPNEKGVPEPRIGFVVESIVQEVEEVDPMDTINAMFPSVQRR